MTKPARRPHSDLAPQGAFAWRRGALACAVALSAGLAACSLLVIRGAAQCETDGDCAGFGPATCTAEKVCRGVDSGVDVKAPVVDANTPCTSNRQCADAAGGAPSICRKDTRVCVTLTNPDCPRVFAVTAAGEVVTDRRAVDDDATIVLGSLSALAGPLQAKGEARVNAVELAMSEFASSGGVAVGAKFRPVAVVSCNDVDLAPPAPSDDPVGVRAARHLVSTVGVPAVIGTTSGGSTTAALKEITQKGALLIAPSTTSTLLTSNPDKAGLFFRTAPSDAAQAPLLGQIVNDFEAAIAAPPDLRLSLVVRGDTYGQGIRDAFVDGLTFNGRRLSDPANAAFYRSSEYKTDPSFAWSSLVSATLAFKPNIVVIAGTNEVIDGFVKPLEAGWPTGSGGAQPPPRPFYLLSNGLKVDKLLEAIAANATGLRTRISGTSLSRPSSITNEFVLRYTARFPTSGGDVGTSAATTFGTAGAYDAAYVLLYALGYVTDEVVTGANLVVGVRSVTRELPSSTVEVGPRDLARARSLIRAGQPLDLNGAATALAFDEAGDTPADIELWCVGQTGAAASPSFFTTDRYYSGISRAVVGTLRDCFL